MQKNYKHILQERLTFYQDWKSDWQDWFKQQEINEKAQRKFYGDRKIFSLIIHFYFLPLNLLKYFKKKRAQHAYNKVLTTIEVLKEELDTINNNQTWRK